jgi:hypothetical protein
VLIAAGDTSLAILSGPRVVASRRGRQLCIERFAVSHATAQELWPVRHRWQWILLVR